jgi:hypothetical protein
LHSTSTPAWKRACANVTTAIRCKRSERDAATRRRRAGAS